ncbi:MAG: F0F1 ATP synthase subunit B' [Beijerinckiaceae bacterium]
MATPSEHAAEIAFPPFDATTFGSQLFWFAIVFSSIYFLTKRVIAPRIEGILADRHARIAGDLQNAGQMQAKAQAAAEAHEKSLADARSNAQGIARQTRDRLNAESDARRKVIEGDVASKLIASEKQVAEMKSRALANVDTIANDAAAAIIEKLIGAKPGADAISAAVKSALGR